MLKYNTGYKQFSNDPKDQSAKIVVNLSCAQNRPRNFIKKMSILKPSNRGRGNPRKGWLDD